MKVRRGLIAVAATLLLGAIPTTLTLAQAQEPRRLGGLSPDAKARLHDGRMAMIKETLKLNPAQLTLWAPVEAQLRAAFAARQKARAERRERFERPSLPDRLDRKSQRLTERAERVKALAEAFRPFYASLTDDQKAVAGVVLRPLWGDRHFGGPRRFMRRASAAEQK